MKNKELTNQINRKIQRLQSEIINLPQGGGLEALKDRLVNIQMGMQGFIDEIDNLDQGGAVKFVPADESLTGDAAFFSREIQINCFGNET